MYKLLIFLDMINALHPLTSSPYTFFPPYLWHFCPSFCRDSSNRLITGTFGCILKIAMWRALFFLSLALSLDFAAAGKSNSELFSGWSSLTSHCFRPPTSRKKKLAAQGRSNRPRPLGHFASALLLATFPCRLPIR